MMYGFIAGMMIAFGGLVAFVCGVFGAWAIVQRYL